MRTRHRIPTIFNLSMVDVLCCALGCVILLWLLNFREAKRRAEDAGQTATRLAAVMKDADALRARLLAAEDDVSSTSTQLASARADADTLLKERDAVRRDLDQTRSRIADLNRDMAQRDKMIASLQSESADAADRLAKKNRELEKEKMTARKRIDDLEVLVREKEKLVGAASRAADDLADRLHDADALAKRLRTQAEMVPGLRDELKTSRERLSTAEEKLVTAGRSLDDLDELKKKLGSDLVLARRRIDELQDDKKALVNEAARARLAAENRFAGIELAGRKVVFLIDMSGSMEMVDENTAAPDKWTGVRETLAKIMRSLPDLEKFQVILFAQNVSYLLGNEESLIQFNAKASPDRVTKALAAFKPKGNTNMYSAFEAAFRFRDQGLDTIYILSDGLPNIGTGLTEEAARNLKETEKAEILGNYVRKTLKTNWNREQRGRPRVRINAVGFFYESPDVGAFLWALARENDGSFVGMSKP